MNPSIIECSASNSRQILSNAEWITTLPSPIMLDNGDSLTVLQSIIDANLSGEYTNILINEPIELTIEFGYYYVNDGISLDYGIGIDDQEPMQFYVARDHFDTGYKLITGTKQIELPAKNYSANELAQYISSQISKLPTFSSLSTYNNSINQIFMPCSNTYRIDCETFSDSVNIGFNSVTAIEQITDSLRLAYAVGIEMIVYYRDNDSKVLNHTVTVTALNQITGVISFTPVINYLENKATISDVYVVLKNPIDIRFFNQAATNNTDYITASTPRYMGTNEFALEYNVNNSGKFQFSIIHTSPYPAQNDDESSINIIKYSTSDELFFEDVRTGIFFTQLEPVEFWQDILGFDLSKLLVIDGQQGATVQQLETKLVRSQNITSNYVGADTLIGNTRTLAEIPTDPYDYKTTITNPIIAPNNFSSQDAGYFLVEIKAIPTDFTNEIKPMGGIVQICSSNWDNNGLITAYSDSSLQFVNNSGSVIILTSFHIRILDALTYKPSLTLGPKSTVFIQKTSAIK